MGAGFAQSAELHGSAAASIFEKTVKMAEILKAGCIGHLLDGHCIIVQKIFGLFESGI